MRTTFSFAVAPLRGVRPTWMAAALVVAMVFAACGGATPEPMHPDPDSDDGGAPAVPAGSGSAAPR